MNSVGIFSTSLPMAAFIWALFDRSPVSAPCRLTFASTAVLGLVTPNPLNIAQRMLGDIKRVWRDKYMSPVIKLIVTTSNFNRHYLVKIEKHTSWGLTTIQKIIWHFYSNMLRSDVTSSGCSLTHSYCTSRARQLLPRAAIYRRNPG